MLWREFFLKLLHLLAFAVLAAGLIGSLLLEVHQRKIQEVHLKLHLLQLLGRMGVIVPLASALLLVTGIATISTLYGIEFLSVSGTGWLGAKIILFVFLFVNGLIFGPILYRKRTAFLKTITTSAFSTEMLETLKTFNKNIGTYYLVQILLLLLIVLLSVLGTTPHT